MARTAQTATAVLGALSVEPMTGYELRQVIAEVLGHFWHESFGQIYPTLTALESEGLIGAVAGERTASRRYSLTPSGQARLVELLTDPPAPQLPRNGTLLRVFFGRSLTAAQLAAILDADEDAALARQAGYAAIRASMAAEPQYDAHQPFWLATLRAGELATAAQLEWIRETKATLLPLLP